MVIALLALAAAPSGLRAQEPQQVPLTLAEAIREALAGNLSLEAASARAEAAAAGARATGSYRFPTVAGTAGWGRTDDPVGVFGTRLRQSRFTAADFDVAALNDPAAVSDWSAGVGVRWEVARLDRRAEADAGLARSRAARAMLERTREGTIYGARVHFAATERAEAALRAAIQAERSAAATAERAARRAEEGMGMQADLLQAEAALEGSRARSQHAQATLHDARDALGRFLGWGPERVPIPMPGGTSGFDEAPSPSPNPAPGRRFDLEAGRAGVEAAEAELRAVRAARLPGIDLLAGASTHAPGLGGDHRLHWTLGLQVTVPVFTGFGLERRAEAASAELRALTLEQEERRRAAEGEHRSALRAVETGRAALGSARTAVAAAEEAVRLLQRRYEEGMATIADLLLAESRAAELARALVDQEASLSVALATLDFVRGAPTPTELRNDER